MTRPRPNVLGAVERRTLAAVCDAMMPRLTAEPGERGELFALSAADVDLATHVEHAMGALGKRQLGELRFFLRLLDVPLFLLVGAGRARRFSTLDTAARETVLLRLANHPVPQLRTGYQALKRLCTFLFYAALDESGANPSWEAIGYSLPRRRQGSAPLTVTPITGPTRLSADACVIGSGAGGGVVAAQLAAAGLTVVVLEAGPADQGIDFDEREVVGMERLYLDQGTTATRDLGVAILAGACLGGGTSVNWQTSLRLPGVIRDEWAARSGIGWLADESFTRSFDAVCARLDVGTRESVRNPNNAALERGCGALGFRCMSIPRNSRGCDLDRCGYCVFGCRVGAKQSTANTFLVDAQRDGATTIVASCRADRLRMQGRTVVGVEATATDRSTGARHAVTVTARSVVVAAGALETPAFLLRSGLDHAHLGRHLHLHPTTAVAGRYPEPIHGWLGAPQSVLCDEFAAARGNYGFRLETAPVHPGLIALAQPWYGARDHRSRMQYAAHVSAVIVLTRDRSTGRVTLDREGRPVVDYALGRMERALMQDGIAAAAHVHWAAGAGEIHALHTRDHTFDRAAAGRGADIDAYMRELARAPVHGNRCAVFSAHQMGTCRMGADAKTSPCDAEGRVRGIAGLHVADASLFPASSGVNPMITIMAMAHRIGAALAGGLRFARS
jgi:choline dehydrogenase-like flavoprotein